VNEWIVGAASALWLGVLTSISPCPLATNIAAISFVGRRVEKTRLVLWGGLLYTAGRTLAYVVLAGLLVAGLLAAPALSQFLQKSMNQILGPVLIVAGMFLLELLSLGWIGGDSEGGLGKIGRRVREWAERDDSLGVWSAGVLGILFALSFCPVSAAIFFGSLIPLSVKENSVVVMPVLYGVGTALPVFGFALLIALGAHRVGETFNRLSQFARYARRVTGGLFVVVGIYFCLIYIFGVL
jgi:cytochrome c biogenesis protein CcdA